MTDDSIEVPRWVLEQLVEFESTHSREYGWEKADNAREVAKDILNTTEDTNESGGEQSVAEVPAPFASTGTDPSEMFTGDVDPFMEPFRDELRGAIESLDGGDVLQFDGRIIGIVNEDTGNFHPVEESILDDNPENND